MCKPKVHYKYYRVNPELPKLKRRKGNPLMRYSKGNGFLVLDRYGRSAFLKQSPAIRGGATIASVKLATKTLNAMVVCSPSDAFCYRDGRDGTEDFEGARDLLLKQILEHGYDGESVEW